MSWTRPLGVDMLLPQSQFSLICKGIISFHPFSKQRTEKTATQDFNIKVNLLSKFETLPASATFSPTQTTVTKWIKIERKISRRYYPAI